MLGSFERLRVGNVVTLIEETLRSGHRLQAIALLPELGKMSRKQIAARLMRCEFVNERTQVNVEIRIMPLYWLCYRHNNQISVVIEPGASILHACASLPASEDVTDRHGFTLPVPHHFLDGRPRTRKTNRPSAGRKARFHKAFRD